MNINRSGGPALPLFASLLMALGTAQAAEVDLLVQLRGSAPASVTGNRSMATKDLASQVPALAGWLQENDVQLVQSISDTTTRGKSLTGPGSIVRIVLESDTAPTELMRDLRARGDVTHVEPNQRGRLATTPTDPFYVEQAGDLAPIGIESAWGIQPGSDASVRVAIIDSGIETTHEDLSGTYDPIASSDVANGRAMLVDEVGHGTRIAGIVGAHGNNGTGIAGVGYGSTLLVYDVYNDDGYILLSDVITAVDRARNDGARVVNLSLAFDAPSRLLEESCRRAEDAGILLVAAAGNDNQGDVPAYPASFSSVMGIGSVNDAGTGRAVFSNYNGIQRDLVDLYAPGSTLFSTVPGSQYNGTFTTGTSFSAPVVCGVAALLMAKYPEQSGAAVRAHLLATASPIAGFQPTGGAGAGLVNAAAALSTPMLPNIRIDRIVVDDRKALDPDNDGDGVLDRGESAELVIFLSNDAADAFDVTATVSTSSGAISSLGDAEANFGELRSGKATSNGGDRIGIVEVDSSAAAQEVAFTLELESDGQSIGALAFSLPLEDEVDANGVVASPRTYTADKTYHVSGNLLWRSAITIEPGTKFKVSPGVTIRVENGATVSAEGIEEAPIIFTSAESAPEPGTSTPFGGLGPRTSEVDLSGIASVIHVNPTTGNDSTGTGTTLNPFKTIQGGVGRIAPLGLTPPFAMLLAEGVYESSLASRISLDADLSIYGGYSSDFSSRHIFKYPSVLDGKGSEYALMLNADGTLADGVFISGGGHGGIANRTESLAWSDVTIQNCILIDNYGSGGTSIRMQGGIDLRNCLFVNNVANSSEAAIEVSQVSDMSVDDCILIANQWAGLQNAMNIEGSAQVRRNLLTGFTGVGIETALAPGNLAEIGNNISVGNEVAILARQGSGNLVPRIYNNHFLQSRTSLRGLAPVEFVNNIVSGSSESTVEVTAGSTLSHNLVEGGLPPGVIDPAMVNAPPRLIGPVHFGTIETAEYLADKRMSRLVTSSSNAFAQPSAGSIISIAGESYFVAYSDSMEIAVVGDATGRGTMSYPNGYTVESYRLSASSPARGAGIGPSADSKVPTYDLDGDLRNGETTDIGPDLYSPEGSGASFAWNTLLIQDSATSATFRHVTFENGAGVQVNNPNVMFDNCSYLNNAEFGLRASVPLSAPIFNARAEYNRGPGLHVPGSTITGGTARANFGNGIVAETVSSVTSLSNGLDGVVADNASTSTARLNLGTGFRTGAVADELLAELNAVGIASAIGAVTNSRTIGNYGVGIEAGSGTVSNSFAFGNGSHGMTVGAVNVSGTTSRSNDGYGVFSTGGANLIDCLLADNLAGAATGVSNVSGSTLSGNGAGISGIATLDGSFVGFNAGDGVHAADVLDSTLVGNSGAGARASSTVTNSWIARNSGVGVDGIGGQGVVSDSTIRENGGGGTLNVLAVSDSNYLANGPIEAEDNVVGGSLADRSLEDNWWGTTHTLTIQNSQPLVDLDFLRDTLDVPSASGDYVLDVWNPATGPVGNAPNSDAPAFVLSVTPNLDEPVNIGPTLFTIEYSSPMDTGVDPSVTFDREAPYTFRVVEPGPGWIDNRTYRGIFWVQGDTGDGLNRVRIDNARDANGFVLPSDSSHPFIIDTNVDTPANNGLATGTGSRTMRLTWDPGPSARPGKTGKGALDRVGYNIQRTTYLDKVGDAALEAGLTRINTSIVYDTFYDDSGLEPNTLYYYRVYDVRPGEVLETEPVNANEWTVFVGLTLPAGDEAPELWMIR